MSLTFRTAVLRDTGDFDLFDLLLHTTLLFGEIPRTQITTHFESLLEILRGDLLNERERERERDFDNNAPAMTNPAKFLKIFQKNLTPTRGLT